MLNLDILQHTQEIGHWPLFMEMKGDCIFPYEQTQFPQLWSVLRKHSYLYVQYNMIALDI